MNPCGPNPCCNAWYASCEVGSNSGVDSLKEPWEKLAESGELPNAGQQTKFKVYSLRSRNLGAHMSLVFTHDDRTFMSVSLCVKKDKENATCYLASKKLDSDVALKLKLHGELTTTVQNIIGTLTDTFKRFGAFNKLTNNCQDFSKAALTSFNLSDTPIGDRTAVLATGGVGATIVAGIAVIAGIFLSKN